MADDPHSLWAMRSSFSGGMGTRLYLKGANSRFRVHRWWVGRLSFTTWDQYSQFRDYGLICHRERHGDMRYRTTGGNNFRISSADLSPSNWTWVLTIRECGCLFFQGRKEFPRDSWCVGSRIVWSSESRWNDCPLGFWPSKIAGQPTKPAS